MKKWDGFDDAIIGPAMVWTEDGTLREVLVYDGEELRKSLMKRDGMSFQDAREFIEFNIDKQAWAVMGSIADGGVY